MTHVLRTGRSELFADVSDDAHMAKVLGVSHTKMIRELGVRSCMCVPFKARGEVIGGLSLATSDSGRRFQGDDLELAEELARRASWARDNARLYQEAQTAVRLRDDVLSVVSHDLRSPLSSIAMSAEALLQRTGSDESVKKLRKSAEVIRRSAGHMRRLIDELVELASIHAGRLVLERSHENVSELLEGALEMVEPFARQKSLRLERKAVGQSFEVLCDKHRIIRVFANLVGNAIKFTPEGGQIVITVEYMDPQVCVSVSDTGPGIAKDDVPRLFDAYWKGKGTGRRGTGLGLYIARGIVQVHGGRIWAESDVGAGSTFFFTMSREQAEGEEGG